MGRWQPLVTHQNIRPLYFQSDREPVLKMWSPNSNAGNPWKLTGSTAPWAPPGTQG